MSKKVDKQLKNYITTQIFPIYQTFDKAHKTEHIKNVVKRSFAIYNTIKNEYTDLDINMIYITACMHDIGIKIDRPTHAIHSKQIVLKDKFLKKYFGQQKLEIIAQACLDHSVSTETEINSIYGKIVFDADKDVDFYTLVYRAFEWTLHYNPDFSNDQHIQNIQDEFIRRYGKNESDDYQVKYNFQTPITIKLFKTIRKYNNNYPLFEKYVKRHFKKLLQK